MRLLWEEKAWEDYCYWQEQDKKTLKRINSLIKDIQRNPFNGIGKPEPYSTKGAAFGLHLVGGCGLPFLCGAPRQEEKPDAIAEHVAGGHGRHSVVCCSFHGAALHENRLRTVQLPHWWAATAIAVTGIVLTYSVNTVIFAGAAAFSLLTVWISVRKPRWMAGAELDAYVENRERVGDLLAERVQLYGMEDFVLGKLKVIAGDMEKYKNGGDPAFCPTAFWCAGRWWRGCGRNKDLTKAPFMHYHSEEELFCDNL